MCPSEPHPALPRTSTRPHCITRGSGWVSSQGIHVTECKAPGVQPPSLPSFPQSGVVFIPLCDSYLPQTVFPKHSVSFSLTCVYLRAVSLQVTPLQSNKTGINTGALPGAQLLGEADLLTQSSRHLAHTGVESQAAPDPELAAEDLIASSLPSLGLARCLGSCGSLQLWVLL